ncbi:MAG: hypothetical protein ABWY25_04335 [Paenisporosarcina sp.]
MLKREITYEDFNGEKVTETFYFNLTKSEIIELNVGYEGGLGSAIQRIVETSDVRSVVAELKKILLMSYGIKSEDGKRFIKSDELRLQFTQTPAYDILFMDIATNDTASAAFIKGILPKDFVEEIEKAEKAANKQPLLPPSVSTGAKETS